MKSKVALHTQLILLVLWTAFISISGAYAGGEPASPPQPQGEKLSLATSNAPQILRVSEGKSFVLNSKESLKRVSVTNDLIASAMVVTPTQVLIHGIKPGTVTLLLWNEQEQVRAFDLQV